LIRNMRALSESMGIVDLPLGSGDSHVTLHR
jgi:hypothetical protein